MSASRISRRSALKSLAVVSVVPAVAVAAVAVDDRKAHLLGALADFDAASSASSLAARRLNAVPVDGSHDAEHARAMDAYEATLERVRLADEQVAAAARRINPAASSIVTREGTYIVVRDDDSFVGQRLFFPAAAAIDLR